MIAQNISAKVTWECIHFGTKLEGREEIALSKQKGIFATAVSVQGVTTKEELLSKISNALSFPSTFGYNWDALDDSLRDLSWLQVKGVLLVLEDSQELWCQPLLSGRLLESWLCCAEDWSQRSVPFHLAFTWD